MKGMLITLDGCRGSGCSTQALELKKHYENLGIPVCVTTLGSSWLVGDFMKDCSQVSKCTMFMLFMCDIVDRINHVIIPKIEAGFVVVADKFAYSAPVLFFDNEVVNDIYEMLSVKTIKILLDVKYDTEMKYLIKNDLYIADRGSMAGIIYGRFNSSNVVDGDESIENVKAEILKIIDSITVS